MSTYQKDWFTSQKHGERNHHNSNRKYNVKLSENNNVYVHQHNPIAAKENGVNNINNQTDSKKKKTLGSLKTGEAELSHGQPVITDVESKENHTQIKSGDGEPIAKQVGNNNNLSVLNMYKMQNASRLFATSYNGSKYNSNNSSHSGSKTSESSLTKVPTSEHYNKTSSNENGHYYSHHYHPQNHNHYNYAPQNPTVKKYYGKGSKSSRPTTATEVPSHTTDKKDTPITETAKTTDTVDFTDKSSELFPALSEAMALAKKQSSKPSTPVVSAQTAMQTAQTAMQPAQTPKSNSPVKVTPAPTYSQEFLYYVGMQMANRWSMPPPAQSAATNNLLHSNLLVQNFNLQSELSAKKTFLEQAMEKSVAAATTKSDPLGNFASINTLLPHIHDRAYDLYEQNQLKGQRRLISKQQEDCFYQNNYNFNYHLHHTGQSNNFYNGHNAQNYNNAGGGNNNSKKQYNYSNYGGNTKKGPHTYSNSNHSNNKYSKNNGQNSNYDRQGNGSTHNGKSNHYNGNGYDPGNLIYVRPERSSNNHYQHNQKNRSNCSPTPTAKSQSSPIAASVTTEDKPISKSSIAKSVPTAITVASSKPNIQIVRKSNSYSPALSSSSSSSLNSVNSCSTEFVSVTPTAVAVASVPKDAPVAVATKRSTTAVQLPIKKKASSEPNVRSNGHYLSDSDSSLSSNSTKNQPPGKQPAHYKRYDYEIIKTNRQSPSGSSSSSSNDYAPSKQNEMLPSCCQEFQQNMPAFGGMDLFLIRTDENSQCIQQTQFHQLQNLNLWNFNYNQPPTNNYVYGSNGSLDMGFTYQTANEVPRAHMTQPNSYGQQPKRKLTGRGVPTVNDSGTHHTNNKNINNNNNNNNSSINNNYISFTPPDRFLARSHLVELKNAPEQLLNDSKWDKLSQSIWNKFVSAQQSEDTYKKKMYLWRHLYICIKKTFPKYGLYLVGSTISGFGADSSDVDMCLVSRTSMFHNTMEPRLEAVLNLTNLKKYLMGTTSNFEQFNLIEAKVPILRFRDEINRLEVDLNYNNCVGIRNTHLLHCYAQMDWRVRPLVLTVKLWAQHHQINNAKNSTISSYSLVLMVIHFLQYAVSPPVLPCLHALYPEKFQKPHDIGSIDMNEELETYHSENQQPLGELMMQFLEYYANFDYAQYAISIRTASLLPIDECRMVKTFKNDPRHWRQLCIEEPFDLTNTARSVYDCEIFERIKEIFMESWHVLQKCNDLHSLFSSLLVDIPLPTFSPPLLSSCSSVTSSLSSASSTTAEIPAVTRVVSATTEFS